jgi:hypothetical protein
MGRGMGKENSPSSYMKIEINRYNVEQLNSSRYKTLEK